MTRVSRPFAQLDTEISVDGPITTEAGQSNASSGGTILEPGGGGTMQAAGPGGEIVETLLSTTYYYYYYWDHYEDANVDHGNVTRVVTEKENPGLFEPRFEATRLVYARNGRAVTYGLAETWDDFTGGTFTDHIVTYIHEYRYDGARQRYLKRELNPEDPLEQGYSLWTDYDGDQPYGDFAVSGGVATEVRSIELGLAKVNAWTSAGGANTEYYHTDMIGTTRHMTNSSGNETGAAVYTAFGEQMAGSSQYYGYAGAWGYETESFPFLHVGHRYYDPAIGRFLQRDPIGMFGGLNVYAYIQNSPTRGVDPFGLQMGLVKGADMLLQCGPGVTRAGLENLKRKHKIEDHPDDPTEECPRCVLFDIFLGRIPAPPAPPGPQPPPLWHPPMLPPPEPPPVMGPPGPPVRIL